jgi:WD40 repeat protein
MSQADLPMAAGQDSVASSLPPQEMSPAPSRPPAVPDHSLLHLIGSGSYGEVWLAQNAVGTLRAVKVVYRARFLENHPFEREFKGIQKFEPLSRSHVGLIDILQIGCNQAGGYFYYVMELADAAAPLAGETMTEGAKETKAEPAPPESSDPHPLSPTYRPRTLRGELKGRGPLPMDECLQIGLALTAALDHLHRHGLVHRDIKPSNIIFVEAAPKLADIGLVTDIGEAHSFVGTAGFIAPEGPGTPQADIYSLGKVLYEISTGLDRQEFPKLPPNLRAWPDAARLIEFNEILLKACEDDPRHRYQSAQSVQGELALLQSGKSIHRLRLVERRLTLLTRAGALLAVLLAVAAALYGSAIRQRRATFRQLYVADMNLAYQAWEGGNLPRARALLETHRRLQPEMLGFDWRLIERLCEESDARITLRGHSGTVWCLAFSPDGSTLATGSADATVKLWDPASGRLEATLTGHGGFVHGVAFSPDGTVLASGSRDFTIKLWEVRSRTEIATLAGHTDAVRALAFSRDGRHLVSGGEDGMLRWWSLDSRREEASLEAGLNVEHLSFSPDGLVLAGCGSDTRVHFWNGQTRAPGRVVEMHQAIVLSLAYSSDGRTLATASYDGTIKLWDTDTYRERAALGRGAPVRCVAFAPGDRFLAAATEDGLVRIWNLARREVAVTLRGHSANVHALAFSPRGGRLASGDEASLAKVWTVSAEPGRENALSHAGLVNSLAFSPNGRILASTDPNIDTLRLWDLNSRRSVSELRTPKEAAWRVAYAPDGTALATGGVDGIVRLWDLATGRESAHFQGHEGGIDVVAFSPDGRWIASGGRDSTARIWSRFTGGPLALFTHAPGPVRALAFHPRGRSLVTGGRDGRIHFWNLPTFREEAAVAEHQGEIRALAFSVHGDWLASGGADRIIRVWETRTRKVVGRLAGHTAMVSSLAFSPDGKVLASGSWDSTVKLWNLRLFREVLTLREHSGQVTQVAFSPDGNTLASSSSDATIRLWRAGP